MNKEIFAEFELTRSLLSDYNIPIPPYYLVQTPREAVDAFEKIGSSVAVKLISTVDSHKTDKGLLKLNIREPSEVDHLTRKFINQSDPASFEGILIQKMAPAGTEILAGLVNDPTFGVMIVFGAGGIWVELMNDPILRLAPIDFNEAIWIINQHPIARLLSGYRGMPPGNINALAQLLEDLSRLGVEHASELDSLDINPVIVASDGVSAVDFRMKLKRG